MRVIVTTCVPSGYVAASYNSCMSPLRNRYPLCSISSPGKLWMHQRAMCSILTACEYSFKTLTIFAWVSVICDSCVSMSCKCVQLCPMLWFSDVCDVETIVEYEQLGFFKYYKSVHLGNPSGLNLGLVRIPANLSVGVYRYILLVFWILFVDFPLKLIFTSIAFIFSKLLVIFRRILFEVFFIFPRGESWIVFFITYWLSTAIYFCTIFTRFCNFQSEFS